MFAESWCWPVDAARGPREFEGGSRKTRDPDLGIADRGDHSARLDLRIRDDLIDVVNGSTRDACLLHDIDPLLDRFCLGDVGDYGLQGGVVFRPQGVRGKTGVLQQLFSAEDAAEAFPVGSADRKDNIAVFRFKGLKGGDRGVPCT